MFQSLMPEINAIMLDSSKIGKFLREFKFGKLY